MKQGVVTGKLKIIAASHIVEKKVANPMETYLKLFHICTLRLTFHLVGLLKVLKFDKSTLQSRLNPFQGQPDKNNLVYRFFR